MTTEQRLSWNDRRGRKRPVVVPIISAPAVRASGGYGPAALAREVALVERAEEGTRNDTLNVAAFNLGQLVPGGYLAAERVTDELAAAARRAGLEEGEIAATIRSGMTEGAKHPRNVDPLVVAGQVEEVGVALITASEASTTADDDAGGSEDGERPRTSWYATSIIERAAGAELAPGPTHLVREDGQPLFYAGKVNGLIGESESGKSWVMLHAAAQALARGERVLLLDFEDSAPGILGRLTALGAEGLDRLDYASPDESLGVLQAADLAEVLQAGGYSFIGVDGVNAAMTLLGYDLNSNTDATLFATKLLRPLASTGAAVVTVDHLPKNADQRGKGGIGAQAKRAMMDGCSLSVEVVEPFGKGQNGILKLKVDKDRPGVVRGASAGSVLAGRALITSHEDGSVSIRIAAPDLRPAEEREAAPTRRTGLMEKISRHLEAATAPVGKNELERAMSSKSQWVREAVASLVAEGYVITTPAPRNGTWHSSRAAYRQANDPDADTFEKASSSLRPSASPLRPGPGAATASLTPLPLRGGDVVSGPSGRGDERDAVEEGYSHCNGCGQLTPDWAVAKGAGYCLACKAAGR